ncbi:hypothetical protein EDB84DRAFT_1499644 [Lactarius hengduanensis]|nr:hypothetical protein EDB84DRAFT_1499644 [Lactarius hengduanensis]
MHHHHHSSTLTAAIALHSPSRPSSSASNRARSPSLSLDDPVSVRHHMSALKHTIRHQQAQLQNLENHLQRTPRLPLTTTTNSPPSSPPSPSPFDVLQSLVGPDSNLPLPRRDPGSLSQDGIREGVPMDFGAGPSSQSYKRQSSPTRTLSRIPVSSVGSKCACSCRRRCP